MVEIVLLASARMIEASDGSSAVVPDDTNLSDTLVPLSDDPSLSLIVDLAGDVEWDATAEAGLSVRGDIVERAVRDLSDDERVELKRMLNDAIANRGV